MRVFKTKWFSKFARKNHIADATLVTIAKGLDEGKWDADLGLDVYKVRIARPNAGKGSGFRTIILYRKGERAFFEYGFPKSERDDIEDFELWNFRDEAANVLNMPEDVLEAQIEGGSFIELNLEG
ncbi:MAG: type II toxin-antitoxin system RelE/ParE family toxin, partial [Spirochaetaceae bacterium]|jgi:hypothetical protein|nr:type II toxin-antitoxin system RelE/ParE family toxin [Spirochaetaceae bacterium]